MAKQRIKRKKKVAPKVTATATAKAKVAGRTKTAEEVLPGDQIMHNAKFGFVTRKLDSDQAFCFIRYWKVIDHKTKKYRYAQHSVMVRVNKLLFMDTVPQVIVGAAIKHLGMSHRLKNFDEGVVDD